MFIRYAVGGGGILDFVRDLDTIIISTMKVIIIKRKYRMNVVIVIA
jgi:hypothetical protein